MNGEKNSKVFGFLNQPFVIWFLSSVLVAVISWQYGEMRKQSEADIENARILRKAKLELSLLIRDIKFGIQQREQLTLPALQILGQKTSYNAVNKQGAFYFPSLMNIMLEIDSRASLNGTELYNAKLYKALEILAKASNRIQPQVRSPVQKIWSLFDATEQGAFDKLEDIIDNVNAYYTAK